MRPANGSTLLRSNANSNALFNASVTCMRTVLAWPGIPSKPTSELTLALTYAPQSDADFRANAAARRSALAENMSRTQVAEAEAKAAAWKPE